MSVGLAGLEFLIDPVGTEAFVDEYWERQPFFADRDDGDYFRSVFSLDALDELLARGDIWHPNVRVFLEGEQLSLSRFGKRWAYGHELHERVIDRGEVLRLLERGATINILGLERSWLSVMDISRRLEVQSGFPVHTTAFLTPSNAANIPPHYDMVDVFVVQVFGTKAWTVWDPARALPLTTDTAGRLFADGDARVSEQRLVGRYLLEPGDTLYVPRGALHEATTTDEMSLHLAFGVNPHRWYDVFDVAVRNAIAGLAANEVFRQALPVGYHAGDGLPGRRGESPMLAMADQFGEALAGGLSRALRKVDEQYLHSRASSRPGQLLDIARADAISLSDRLAVRPNLAYGLTEADERVVLVFHQKTLSLGAELGDALAFVCSGDTFVVGDIPSLSDEGRLRFAERLVREGFLTMT
jgi:ribosomal protein L16 Arg81 hydroxylase